MRLLHISDLHASANALRDQSHVLEAFFRDVEIQHAAQPIDAVVFTGDLAQSGGMDEFQLGEEVLLRPLEKQLRLPRDRFFLVPGNHDVLRSEVDPYLETGLREALVSEEAVNAMFDKPEALARAAERLSEWTSFERTYYEGTTRSLTPSLGWTSKIELGSRTIGFACLNSSWRAQGGAEDFQRLVIGDRQLASTVHALDEGFDLRVVAVHHPANWLTTWDENSARAYFEARPSIVLSGHRHESDPTFEITTRGTAVYGRSGCLYDSRAYENSYSVVDVDFDAGEVRFTIRAWYPERAVFDAATGVAENGIVSYPLPRARSTSLAIARPYNDVMGVLTDQVYEKSVIPDHVAAQQIKTLHDILVAPRFFGLPYQDARAAMRVGGAAKPSNVDPLGALSDGKVVIIGGDEQSGVSNALIWLQAIAFETGGGHVPVFSTFDAKFKVGRFEKRLRERALLVAQLPNDGPLPPLVIALDDVRADGRGYYAAFAKYVAAHPEHRFILGVHGDGHVVLAEELEAQGIVVQKAFLGPFGTGQVRDLIQKLTGAEEAAILSRVREVISLAHLPRTPFIMATLIVVLSQQRQLAALNESGLLDTYVSVLLAAEPAGAIDEQAMDPRRREYFLAWFASLLARKGVRRIPRVEAEQAFMQRFQDFGWGVASSPGIVLQSLIDRRVLSQDADGVGFRLPGLQAFFAAKHMNSDPEFAAFILNDALAHDEVVRHAAGLERTDRDLLAQIGVIAGRSVFDDGLDVTTGMFDLIRNRPGWSSDEPGVEQLRRRLKALDGAFKRFTDEVIDEQLDEYHDEIEANGYEESGVKELNDFDRLFSSVGLLSSVLRSSELVDDLELKEQLFKDSVHGWGLVAVIWAVREDQSRAIVEMIYKNLPEIRENEELSNRISRLSELLTTFILSFIMLGELGSVHMEEVIRRSLDDDTFMEDSAHALLATVLYGQLRLPGWIARLAALYESHGRNPLIAEMVRITAVISYRQIPGLTKVERDGLEALITRVYAPDAIIPKGAEGKRMRGEAKAEVLRALRKSRRELEKPVANLEPFDELDDVTELDDGGTHEAD